MNKKQLLLGDYFEAGRIVAGGARPLKRGTVPQNKIEQIISQYYQSISQQIDKAGLDVQLDDELEDPCEKVTVMAALIEQLLQERLQKNLKEECEDCVNYEKHLQKLEADVRQHIRLEQQLKLYQDNIEEKNEEAKRQNKQLQKELDSLRRKNDEFRQGQERISKLEIENQQLRTELKNIRSGKNKKEDVPANGVRYNNESLEKPSSSQSQYRKFDSKTGLAEKYPLTRTINFSSNVNVEERKSMDKKPNGEHRLDTEKYRQSLNNKSANMLRPPTDRRRYEDRSVVKDKENQKRKTNNHKVEYRR